MCIGLSPENDNADDVGALESIRYVECEETRIDEARGRRVVAGDVGESIVLKNEHVDLLTQGEY